MKSVPVFFLNFLYLQFSCTSLAAGISSKPHLEINFDPLKSIVSFSAIGRPSAIKIKGKGVGPKGKINLTDTTVMGKVTFDLESLETGIGLRDVHMKTKYLQTDQYRLATFTFVAFRVDESLFLKLKTSMQTIPFHGLLGLHGVEKEIPGVVHLKLDKKEVEYKVDFDISVSDFGIQVPSFAGITMTKEVKVYVEGIADLNFKETKE